MRRPVLRYHGGKWRIATWVISHFPEHRTYVEPFGGGGAVLMKKPRVGCEIYNDLWDDIVSVFRVLRDPEQAAKLQQLCELTPFSRTEMLDCDVVSGDPVEDARRIIFRSFAGFGSAAANSLHKTGFRSATRANRQSCGMDWRNWPDSIVEFTERLRGVVIENREATELIAQHDSPETLFYLDPPYVQATRGMRRRNASYRHEMTDNDHMQLAAAAHNAKGYVLISGYHSDLYDDLFRDWEFDERTTYADGANKRLEVLWANERTWRAIDEGLASA